MHLEMATRGQTDNNLWIMLRLDRHTASGAPTHSAVSQNAAMSFGHQHEVMVKRHKSIMKIIRKSVEKKLNLKVKEYIENCGMFLTPLGLYSASPDAYFVMDDKSVVPIEIKCPYTYRETSVDEMRNALNCRKTRYRVKHTAFSVNKTGPAIFKVEKTDPHYRQMQRQMYVLQAPIAVYLVKFKDSYVAELVDRDNEFCLNEKNKEKNLYEMFARANKQNVQRYSSETNRLNSFNSQPHSFDAKQIKRLAVCGIYYDYGQLVCVHCRRNKQSVDDTFDDVINTHSNCYRVVDTANSLGNQLFVHDNFKDHAKRMQSLQKIKVNPCLAAQGVFCKTKTIIDWLRFVAGSVLVSTIKSLFIYKIVIITKGFVKINKTDFLILCILFYSYVACVKS
ncbi:alkaline exonuclease [Ectropis obliqua nucleopolyhedrovirus]|uniref:Alkaline exonuclease n=1 Tax=Ectropis obliqua nucleopolyhedrovirus TaxID=59376 RepID=A0EYZ6_9ABAC|nr:alkaline exonuclease [Ectropis obliqua nucleopolyhedrovirus]ABI35776.1 alkaline exonuclease [Ectropis obliqua nucleopolyhedrovirus]